MIWRQDIFCPEHPHPRELSATSARDVHYNQSDHTGAREAPDGDRCEGHHLGVLRRSRADPGRSIWQLRDAQRAARPGGRMLQRKEHWGEESKRVRCTKMSCPCLNTINSFVLGPASPVCNQCLVNLSY